MINTQSFTTLVQNAVAAIQGRATKLRDVTVGSVLRATTEAWAAVVIWLQSEILKVVALTRASTSTGSDLDSWMADYFFYREAATFATGLVTFGRLTDTAQAQVNVGATVETQDGSQTYVVIVDTANSYWSDSLQAYVLTAGTPSIDVPVKALVAGSAGNAIIGAVNTLASAMPGIDTCINAAALANGLDAESDAAFRARFQLFLAGLSQGTLAAIKAAIAGVQQGLSYAVVENQQPNGDTDNGFFYAVVDDGTGSPSSDLLNSVANAIDAVRALSVRFTVIGPIVVVADESMVLTLAAGYDHTTTCNLVKDALTNYTNSLGLGVGLPFTRLAQVAYDTSPGVINVASVSLNGGTADIAGVAKQVIRAGTISVSAAP